jgi:hypothetical protein
MKDLAAARYFLIESGACVIIALFTVSAGTKSARSGLKTFFKIPIFILSGRRVPLERGNPSVLIAVRKNVQTHRYFFMPDT